MARPVTFILAPIDQGTRNLGGREGSAEGPYALFDAVDQAGLVPPGADQLEVGAVNTEASLEADLELLSAAVAYTLANERFPLVLGGDHGTSYATARSMARAGIGTPGVAYLDVHLDVRDHTPVHTSGSSFHRLVAEGLVRPDRVRPLGIVRPTDPAALERSRFDELAAWADEQGVPWHSLADVRDAGPGEAVAEAMADEGPWLLSFDTDCLDETLAPGVSAPGSGRFTLDEAIAAVAAGAPRASAFDVVEFVPRLDPDGRTVESLLAIVEAFLEARLVSE